MLVDGAMSDYEDSDMSSDEAQTPTVAQFRRVQDVMDNQDSVSDAPTPDSTYDGDSEMSDTDDGTGEDEGPPSRFDWDNPMVATFTRSGNHINF